MALPEAFLTELRYKCDIERIIGGYVTLKRRGRISNGLCPFHSEKSPSFTVYPDTQSFYCFGCGAGGDIITFIKKAENLEYLEAVRFLADKVGIAMPEADVDDGSRERRMRLQEMNREAARFFHSNLMSDMGKSARKYLAGRGMTKSMVIKFGIGYTPDDWHLLCNFLRSKGYRNEEIVAASLAGNGKKGGIYDSFRNRIIFPIIDLRGGVIGFGGRLIDGTGPKYLNSGDTQIFKKSRNLFAMNFAKNTKRKYVILAEGYMDVVSIYQGGFDNAVATLGTAITEEQARLIATYTEEVVIAYDSDGPGQAATKRAVNLLEKAGVKIKILSMQGAKDPDEYIKKFGAQRFEMLINGSQSALDFEIAKLYAKHDTTIAEQKVLFLQDFVTLMSNTPNPIQRDVYISKIARELETSRQLIVAQLETALKRKKHSAEKKEAKNLRPFIESSPLTKGDFEKQKYPKEALAAERLIAYLMKNPERLEWVDEQISQEMIVSTLDKDIYNAVAERIRNGLLPDMLALSSILEENRISRLSEILSADGGVNVSHEEAEDYIKVLKSHKQVKKPDEVAKLNDEDLKSYIASLSQSKK